MKKTLLFLLIALGTSYMACAQNDSKLKISVGPELSFPTGSFGTGYSFGIGATGQVEYNVQENLYVTGTSGVMFYNGKSLGGGIKNSGTNIIPIKVGAKYFLVGGVYVAAQLGVGIFNKGGGAAFAYTPLAGYEFKTKSDKAIDAAFKYDGYSKSGGTLGAIGFRLAYIF